MAGKPTGGESGPSPFTVPTDVEGRLAAMYDQVVGWRKLTDQYPVIAVNSSLAREGQAFPDAPGAYLAWQAIISAVDHLDMFHATLRATRMVFVYGYYTVARSAGICAARALWVLDGPTREVRIERGLVLTLNEYRQQLATLEDMRGFDGPMDGLEERIESTNRQITKVVDAAKALGIPDLNKRRVNDTVVLHDVLDQFNAGKSDKEQQEAAFMVNWRMSGGTAHGQLWPALLRSPEFLIIDGQPYARVTAGGLDALQTIAAAAHSLTARAIELFQLRAQSS